MTYSRELSEIVVLLEVLSAGMTLTMPLKGEDG